MILLQSSSTSGFLIALILCGNPFAFGLEAGGPPQAPVPVNAGSPSLPVSDLGMHAFDPVAISAAPVCGTEPIDPGAPDDCQCRYCRPTKHRSRGLFGWFQGHSTEECVSESNAACAECNVNPEPPFGSSYYALMHSQIAKGEASLMVLHHFDFVPCQGELNYRGRLQLQKIVRRAVQNPFPIIIEATRDDPHLDAARRAAVISEMAFLPIPEERVVIGLSPARAMDGIDAELVHQNLLRMTGSGSGQDSAPSGDAEAGGMSSP